MDYYFSYETLSSGKSCGKGTTVFEARDLSEAFEKVPEMLRQIARPEALAPDVEERVTVGNGRMNCSFRSRMVRPVRGRGTLRALATSNGIRSAAFVFLSEERKYWLSRGGNVR